MNINYLFVIDLVNSLKCHCPCFIKIEHSSNGGIVAEGFFAHNKELVQIIVKVLLKQLSVRFPMN